MTDRRIPWVGLLLCGCLDINTSGGILDEQYEEAIGDQLRAGAQVLFEIDGNFSVHPVLSSGVNSSGDPATRVDAYPLDVDAEWTGLIGAHAVELTTSDGTVGATEDTFHFEKLGSHTNGEYTSLLYCDDTLDLWVHALTPDGWRYGTVPLGDPAACLGTWVLGEGDEPSSHALWSDQGAELLRFTPPDGTGDIAVDRSPIPAPEGAPEHVYWVAATPDGGVSVVGRSDDGSWVYATSAGAPLTGTGIRGEPLGQSPVAPLDASTLDVWTTEGHWTWDVGAGADPSLVEAFAPPDIDAPWVPGSWPGGALATVRQLHPESELIEVEVAVEALVRDDSVLRRLEVPLTPCVQDAPCQALGEWSVAGLYTGGGRWYAIYGYLSWWYGVNGEEITGVILAPIEDPS